MRLQMKGDQGQLRPLFSRPASAFGSPSLSPLCPVLPCLPHHLPTDLSLQQTRPYACSPERVCSASAHLLSLQVHVGLLEPRLAANRVSEHPPRAWLKPSARCGGSDPWAGDGHPRVAIPQCTVPQRAATGHQGHRALRPGTAGDSTAHKKTRARLPSASLSLHSVSPEEPAV